MEAQFRDLVGQTITSINIDMEKAHIIFETDKGSYQMYHEQDCCEDVYIDDIVGDINDLIGSPIIMAEEIYNREDPMGKELYDSFTWSFYKLATIEGYVTIKWWGESNGYYSEEVTFVKI